MSYNGSGTFVVNSSGQPVVTGTVISSTAFNALTADLATGLSTAITKDGQTTTTARILFAQGVSSTLVTDATSATTGSIITAGGISAQKALWVGTTTTLAGALTYGGVTLSNSVTGTGSMVLSASPTLTGTLTAAAANFSGLITGSAKAVINPAATPTTAATATQLGIGEATNNASYRLNLGYWIDSGIYRGNIDAITGGTAATLTLNSTGGLVGIGMTPSNILDITQTGNVVSTVKILNTTGGSNNAAAFQATSNAGDALWQMNSTIRAYQGLMANAACLESTGSGGMSFWNTNSAPFVWFQGAGTEIARFDTSGRLLVNTTTVIDGEKLNVKGSGTGHAAIIQDGSGNRIFEVYIGPNGMGGSPNGASTAVYLLKDAATNRSVNAAGTLNASGADYADYYHKAPNCAELPKGALVGIDENGLLTDKWSAAKSFKFKSTAPSMVGGDIWGTEHSLGLSRPFPPQEPVALVDAIDKASYDAALDKFNEDKLVYEAALEEARQKVDRIACAGKIPAILSGSFAAGDLILPQQDGDGIKAVCVSVAEATFEQFKSHVGRVLVAEPSDDQFTALIGPDIPMAGAWNSIIDI
jgi:hypothetical protein